VNRSTAEVLGDEPNCREFATGIVALKPGNYVNADNKIDVQRIGADAPARLRRGSLRTTG
jgi:hypothetical protein